MPHLGDKLKALRGTLSLYEVERQTGIQRTVLNNYERGKHFPTPKSLEKLAAFYKIPYKELRLLYYHDYYADHPTEAEITLEWAKQILETR